MKPRESPPTSHLLNTHDHRALSWVFSGSWFEENNRPIAIALHDNLKFEIIVGRNATQLRSHWEWELVDQFRRVIATGGDDPSFEVGFRGLGLRNDQSGERGSHDEESPVLLNKCMGIRKGRPVVTRVWDVSTGLSTCTLAASLSARRTKSG